MERRDVKRLRDLHRKLKQRRADEAALAAGTGTCGIASGSGKATGCEGIS